MIATGTPGIRNRADDDRLEPFGGSATGGLEDEEGRPFPDEKHGEGYDDIGNPRDHDQCAVDRAEDETESEDERHHEDRELLARAIHQRGGGDAGERHHRGDRQIDAAGNHHDGLSRDGKGEGEGGADERADARRGIVGLDQPREDEEDAEQRRTGR